MSDQLKQAAKENRILEINTGSNLYGTATSESDLDFVGVFLPPKEYILGLQSVKEVDIGIKSKDENDKNTSTAVDRKLYEFRQFINLALKNNPNILELLFAPEEYILFINGWGEELLAMRHKFPSQQCITKFLGYARSQKHKMIIRKDHFHELRDGYGFLNLMDPKFTMGQVYDRMLECDPKAKTFWKKETGAHIHCGDICFEPSVYAKKAHKILEERLKKATNRTELVLKHGYDSKFGSHLIRLLYEELMLLERGELIFPLPMSDILLDIKQGKWEIDKVLEHAEKLEDKIGEAASKTKLPKNANFKEIEAFTISILSKHLMLY